MAAIITVIKVAEAVERNSKIRSPGRFTPEPDFTVAASELPVEEAGREAASFCSFGGAVVRLLSAMRLRNPFQRKLWK